MKSLIKNGVIALGALLISFSFQSATAGADIFQVTDDITVRTSDTDDVFVVAKNLRIAAPISGAAHVVAAQVDIDAEVEKSVFALAEQVNIHGQIQRDAYLIGNSIHIAKTIVGDLRSLGDNITLTAPVHGEVMATAGNIYIDSVIDGDVTLAVGNASFGDNAKIIGSLTLYQDADQEFTIPSHVIASEKIERITYQDFDAYQGSNAMYGHYPEYNWRNLLGDILGMFVLTLVLALFARGFITKSQQAHGDRLLMTLFHGGLVLALLVGASMVMAITIIGIPITLMLIIVTLLASLLAYLACTYVIGVQLWQEVLNKSDQGMLNLIMTCLLGAVAVQLVTSIPWLGSLIGFGILLYGIGIMSPWSFGRRS